MRNWFRRHTNFCNGFCAHPSGKYADQRSSPIIHYRQSKHPNLNRRPPPPVTASSIQRWSITNGFYALNVFGDGTILAASATTDNAAKLNPHDGTTVAPYPFLPDVRTSIRLSTGDQDYVVGGYENRYAVSEDGTLVRQLNGLGCCNIPRFPMALDPVNDLAYVQANGTLFASNMSTGSVTSPGDPTGDAFGMVGLADASLIYTVGRSGNVARDHMGSNPTRVWTQTIDTGDLQPMAIAADESLVVTLGSPHFAGATQPGRLAHISPSGTPIFNIPVNAVTPPVIGGNGFIFVGTQPAPINESGTGSINAYDPSNGALVWSTAVQGLPNDLLVGDDGAVYAGTGSFSNGNVYALGQSDGAIRKTITDVPGAWEIILRAGLLYASGTSITALPVSANNYDPNSPWPVRFHDNQRTSNRLAPSPVPARDVAATFPRGVSGGHGHISGNTTIPPAAPPADTTRLTVSTGTNFKGHLEIDQSTGVIRITNANPASNLQPGGSFAVTVRADGPAARPPDHFHSSSPRRTVVLALHSPPPSRSTSETDHARSR